MADDPKIPFASFAPALRALLGIVFRLFGGIVSVGHENVPRAGPVMLCPNHISDCDPLAIYLTSPRRDIHFIAKEELFKIPILGSGMRAFGSFPIRRGSADRAAIRQAEEVLEGGSTLVLFPEGHISVSGNLNAILPGAALIALHADAVVVPVGIKRTNCILPYGHIFPSFSRLSARVVYGKAISPHELSETKGKKAIGELTERIEREIRNLTGQ